MKTFISWSGARSRTIADILRRWLPSVLQAVRPYFSPDDIAKGTRWTSEISKELEMSRIGLLIVTPENQESPWLMFEAGALAKNLDQSRVCPLLFGGLHATDIKGPLVQFQTAEFSKEEMKRVLRMINGELGDLALSSDVLAEVYEMWWGRLEEQVGSVAEDENTLEKSRRPDRELLEEILSLTRRVSTNSLRPTRIGDLAWKHLIRRAISLEEALQKDACDDAIADAVREVITLAKVIATREGIGAPLRLNLTKPSDFEVEAYEAPAVDINEFGSGFIQTP